jgi:hypothetical protein
LDSDKIESLGIAAWDRSILQAAKNEHDKM